MGLRAHVVMHIVPFGRNTSNSFLCEIKLSELLIRNSLTCNFLHLNRFNRHHLLTYRSIQNFLHLFPPLTGSRLKNELTSSNFYCWIPIGCRHRCVHVIFDLIHYFQCLWSVLECCLRSTWFNSRCLSFRRWFQIESEWQLMSWTWWF